MNFLDWIIVLPLLYFAFTGFKNGLVKEVFSIAGIVVGVFLAFNYMEPFGMILQPLIGKELVSMPLVAGSLIFLMILLITHLTAFLIKKFLEKIYFNIPNRVLGMAFGALKSGLIISTILIIMAGFDLPSKEVRDRSVTYPVVLSLAPVAYDLIATVYPGADNFTDTIQKSLDEYNPLKQSPVFKK